MTGEDILRLLKKKKKVMIASEIAKELDYPYVKCLQILSRLRKGKYIKSKDLSMEEARKHNKNIKRGVKGYYES